jgi:hypothetical protein
LERAARTLQVNYEEINKAGLGYPDIASAICKAHSEAVGDKYESSLSALKREIAVLTAWYPNRPRCFKLQLTALNESPGLVGEGLGESWAAKQTWDKRKGDLTKEMIEELKNIAEQHRYSRLRQLIRSIPLPSELGRATGASR